MNNQELLRACLEKIELYHAAMKGEYQGGMPNQVLLPALREAIANPRSLPPEEGRTNLEVAGFFKRTADGWVEVSDREACEREGEHICFLYREVPSPKPSKEPSDG